MKNAMTSGVLHTYTQYSPAIFIRAVIISFFIVTDLLILGHYLVTVHKF